MLQIWHKQACASIRCFGTSGNRRVEVAGVEVAKGGVWFPAFSLPAKCQVTQE